MKHFSYEGVRMWHMHTEAIKEVLAWATTKHFQFSNNIMLLKTVLTLSYQRIKLYNYIVYIAMWSLVTIMCNCGIQLFCGTVKYCISHTSVFTVHVA